LLIGFNEQDLFVFDNHAFDADKKCLHFNLSEALIL
jgi:hypothetical protein